MSRSESTYHHGNLASVIENAALELLDSQPHTTMSLREISRHAGVSHNAPYHHFSDKQALLKRLSVVCMGELVQAQATAARLVGDRGARPVAIGVAYVTYAIQYPHRFNLIYDPEVCVPGAPSPEMAPLIDQLEGFAAEAALDIVGPNNPERVETFAKALWSTVHGLSQLVIAGHLEAKDIEQILVSVLQYDLA